MERKTRPRHDFDPATNRCRHCGTLEYKVYDPRGYCHREFARTRGRSLSRTKKALPE